MRRAWFFVLAASIGLNAGLLWVQFSHGPRPLLGPPPFVGRGQGPPPMAFAQDPERVVVRHVERLGRELELTDEQRASVEELLRDRLPRLVELRDRMFEARRDVAEAFREPGFDGRRFRELVAALRGAQAQLDSLTAEVMLAEAELLTPDQRDRYLEVMPWGLGGPGGPGGGRPGMRGGPPGGPGPPGGGTRRRGI